MFVISMIEANFSGRSGGELGSTDHPWGPFKGAAPAPDLTSMAPVEEMKTEWADWAEDKVEPGT